MGATKHINIKKRQIGKHFRPNIKRQSICRLKLRPLKPEEREMAEDHHFLVLNFLQANGLPMEDYYDVVIFRYLMAVEKWFRWPQHYRTSFSAMAWEAMSLALFQEREKQQRYPRFVSMEDHIHGFAGSPGQRPFQIRT